MNYEDLLNDPKVIEQYNRIDSINSEPFSHGLKHIRNVCEIINRLCNVLEIDSEERDALLIAGVLHDIGQAEEKDNHGVKSKNFTIDNYKEKLEKNKYYNDILRAIEVHDCIAKEDDSLFVQLLRFADKMDFSKDRLENNYREKYDYVFTERIDDVQYILNADCFGIDIITSDIDDFEDKFLSLNFFHNVINLVDCLANKLNRKPIILNNGIVMKRIIFKR
jgi:HD superfamily phosphohydrolase YqeK